MIGAPGTRYPAAAVLLNEGITDQPQISCKYFMYLLVSINQKIIVLVCIVVVSIFH